MCFRSGWLGLCRPAVFFLLSRSSPPRRSSSGPIGRPPVQHSEPHALPPGGIGSLLTASQPHSRAPLVGGGRRRSHSSGEPYLQPALGRPSSGVMAEAFCPVRRISLNNLFTLTPTGFYRWHPLVHTRPALILRSQRLPDGSFRTGLPCWRRTCTKDYHWTLVRSLGLTGPLSFPGALPGLPPPDALKRPLSGTANTSARNCGVAGPNDSSPR